MRRVLLVLEDYNETLFVETVLKKVGFDVESIPSEMSLPDKMVGYLPDLVIATGDGTRVNGNSVAKKVKRKGFTAKLLLVFTRQKLAQREYISSFYAEGAIETPINPRVLLRSVCDFTNLPSEPILAKFDKLPLAQAIAQETIQIVSGGGGALPLPISSGVAPVDSTLKAKLVGGAAGAGEGYYGQFVKDYPAEPLEALSHKAVERERKRQRDLPDTKTELEIDELRRGFVEKLFKGWKR